LILLTGIAFAIGLSVSLIQTRRRVRRKVTERLVAEAQSRIRAEVLRRLQEQARAEISKMKAASAGPKT
jgi:hypothetical protein